MALKPLIAGMSQGSAGGAGGAPSGTAGGGLGGTYPNPTVNPQLPFWTYTAGTIGSGLFKTNNVAIASTTSITLATPIVLTASEYENLVVGSFIIFSNNSGSVPFYVTGVSGDVDGNTILIVSVHAYSGNWSGLYTVSFLPSAQTATQVGLGNVTNDTQLKASDLATDGTLNANSDSKIASQKATKTYADSLGIVLDSGWTANYDVGDKTVQIAGTSTIAGTIASTVSGLDPTNTLGLALAFSYFQVVAEKVKAIEYALSIQKRPNA